MLQGLEVRPVDGARSRAVDVRVVAATNRDLWRGGPSCAIRPDLYFRLAIFPLLIRMSDAVLARAKSGASKL